MTHPSACPSLRHTFGLLVILTAPARPTRQLGDTIALVLGAIFVYASCCWVVMDSLAAGLIGRAAVTFTSSNVTMSDTTMTGTSHENQVSSMISTKTLNSE